MADTLYAVDIRLVDGSSTGPSGGQDSTTLKDLADSWSRIERGLSSGRIGGGVAGMGAAWSALSNPYAWGVVAGAAIYAAIVISAAKIGSAFVEQYSPPKNAQTPPSKDGYASTPEHPLSIHDASDLMGNLGGSTPMGLPSQTPEVTYDNSIAGYRLKTEADRFGPGNKNMADTGFNAMDEMGLYAGKQTKEQARIAKDIAIIRKDGKTTEEEYVQLGKLSNELLKENASILQEEVDKNVDNTAQRQRSFDLMNGITEAQKQINFSTQMTKASIDSNNQSLERQAELYARIRREKEKMEKGGRSSGVSSQVVDYTLHTGASYSTTETSVLALKSTGLNNAQIINKLLAGG